MFKLKEIKPICVDTYIDNDHLYLKYYGTAIDEEENERKVYVVIPKIDLDITKLICNYKDNKYESKIELNLCYDKHGDMFAFSVNEMCNEQEMIELAEKYIGKDYANKVKRLFKIIDNFHDEIADLENKIDTVINQNNMRNKILALTDNKVDVIDDKGNYKSKEILLNEIAQVWDSIKEKDDGKQTN